MIEPDSNNKMRPEHLESFDSGIIMMGSDGKVKADFKHIQRMNDREAHTDHKPPTTNNNSESDEGHSSNCDQMSNMSLQDNDGSSVVDSDSDMDGRQIAPNKAASASQGNTTVCKRPADDDSSVVDSDSDDDFMERPPPMASFMSEKVIGLDNAHAPDGVVMVSSGLPQLAKEPKTTIGSIAVKDSSDITFGNKTFYQGPVTIKQFMMTNNKWKPADGSHDNPAYCGDSERNPNQLESNDKDGDNSNESRFDKLRKRPLLLTGCIAVCILIIGLTAVLVSVLNSDNTPVYTGDGDDTDRINNPIPSTIGADLITGGTDVLRKVSRGEWIAQPPNTELTDLELPSEKVIIAHTATENCTTQSACVYRVRFIQNFHIESQNWDDIGYNFLVGGDGAAYVGRGWDKQGAHTKGYNKKSICIAFIGTFTKQVPPDRQIRAAKLLIEEGVRLKKLAPDYKVFAHRQLIASESPGEPFYRLIQKWPHWSKDI